jgi:hypothetical protein
MPGIRGRSLSTSGSLAAAVTRARWTSHHETPYTAAASVAARPDSMTAETSVFWSWPGKSSARCYAVPAQDPGATQDRLPSARNAQPASIQSVGSNTLRPSTIIL